MLVERIDHERWAEVVLNRPATRNAITGPLGVELAAAIEEIDGDSSIEVLVLRGAEGAFCSGLDLKAFNAEPEPDWMPKFPAIWRRVHTSLFNLTKPCIAAVERFAINGGAALALAADLLICGRESYVQVGEVQQGMAAPYNISWLRKRQSEAVAAQMALVGKRFSGEELHRMGVAFAAPPDDEVVTNATDLAEKLAAYPPRATSRIKNLLKAYDNPSAEEWFDTAARRLSGSRVKPKAVQS